MWVERSESVEVPLPSTAKRFLAVPTDISGVPNTSPTESQKGVFRLLSWKSDPQVTSPLSIVHELLFKIKNDSGSLCQESKRGKEEAR